MTTRKTLALMSASPDTVEALADILAMFEPDPEFPDEAPTWPRPPQDWDPEELAWMALIGDRR